MDERNGSDLLIGIIATVLIGAVVVAGILFFAPTVSIEAPAVVPVTPSDEPSVEQPVAPTTKQIDFSSLDPSFKFTADIPGAWMVEYVPELQSFNVYDPSDDAATVRDQSQIFVRQFTADRFLTLSTVTIFDQTDTIVHERSARRYDILKRTEAADFAGQPRWRNERHQLLDIRLSDDSPSVFYVFAYNPALPAQVFDAFIDSLQFHDPAAWVSPLDRADGRVTKKRFGDFITPATSPVPNDRFEGYHTGIDYELLPGDIDGQVSIRAACTGEIVVKRAASGYGGVVVQSCELAGDPVSVVYGHLSLGSVKAEIDDRVESGQPLGRLGTGFTKDTDFERGHLHFGIYKGSEVNIAGYVQRESELENWIDPLTALTP